MSLVLGYTDVELDGRFGIVRAQECLLGNFITDLMKEVCFDRLISLNVIIWFESNHMKTVNADCAILNSGSLRSDCITHVGQLTYGEFKKICPSLFPIILFSCSGLALLWFFDFWVYFSWISDTLRRNSSSMSGELSLAVSQIGRTFFTSLRHSIRIWPVQAKRKSSWSPFSQSEQWTIRFSTRVQSSYENLCEKWSWRLLDDQRLSLTYW